MKMRNVVFSLILVVGLALTLIEGQAWGWGGVENPYDLQPKAKGTQYEGTLTIYFEWTDDPFINHMYFFVRLEHHKKLYFYSYDAGLVPHESQAELEAFHEFIEATFIQEICTTSSCPSFANGRVALRSLTESFYNLDFEPSYFIADIEIAVKK